MKKYFAKFVLVFTLLLLLLMNCTSTFLGRTAFADTTDITLGALSNFLDGAGPGGIVFGIAKDLVLDAFFDWLTSNPHTQALFKALSRSRQCRQRV